MNRRTHQLSVAALVATLSASSAMTAEPQTAVTPLLTKPLVGVDGQEGAMITVDIPAGADSPPHRHNANTFVYVLEGTVEMQVQGGKLVTLNAGQTFYEAPNDVHTVSRNASKTKPAKLLVVFVKPVGAPMTLPAK